LVWTEAAIVVSTKTRRFTNGLVDLKAGAISREIFVNEDIYRQEQERVFARSWLFVGHESQVQKPGDYFVSCMGEESVILSRDRDDRIHAFLNSCRHRGMRVCRYDEGNTPIFTCPYHGWSYATDGKLVGVPYFKDAYHEKLDKSRWGLVEVAQLYNYKGSIWATWEPSAPPFLEYLGDMKLYLDQLLDCRDGREGGSEVIGGVQKWTMPANWKFPSENFAGDGYHNISHRSVDMVGIGPSGRGRRDNAEFSAARRVNFSFPDLGHAAVCDLHLQDVPYVPTYQNTPIAEEYFKHIFEERKRRLGDSSRLLGLVGTVFPNMSYLARQPRSIAVWHPRGPHKTEAWRWFLVDKDAPAEVKDTLRHYYVRYSGPAGMTEQDDMENWNYAHAASRGVIARRHPYNYEMGLGCEKIDAAYSGVVTERINEENARGFYTRWAAVMDAKSLDDLPPNGRSSRTHPPNGGGNGRRLK
jgi:phenylpropionate dioxygenase-like ring-hydroxylating dioxygenase large terminal subunit